MSDKNLQVLTETPEKFLQYETDIPLTWCEGCGNFSITNAIRRALAAQSLDKTDVVFCYDVGCSGNGSDKIEGYTIHGLHGRVLPLAAGVKIARPELKVIAQAGDGATFSEGVNHLVHAIRNDYPIVFLLHNNHNYALTTGQPSSLSPKGRCMNAAPKGVEQDPLNPIEFILGLRPSFVARSASVLTDHLSATIESALNHKGFAFVEILQTCPTYYKESTDGWYLENTKEILSEFPNYDPTDILQARKISESFSPLYLGKIYENPNKEDYLQSIYKDQVPRNLSAEVSSEFFENIKESY